VSRATQFEKRFVAFVDILGFQALVERVTTDASTFRMVRDALKTIRSQAASCEDYRVRSEQKQRDIRRAGRVSLMPPSLRTRLEMTAFSDSYVISETFPAWHVLAAVQALGANLISHGILSRGGIVCGPAYHKSGILFGPAVIDAYRLESEVAVYPRILISEAVREVIWGYHRGICQNKLLIQDFDGQWFVNIFVPPLSSWIASSHIPRPAEKEHLSAIHRHLIDHLAQTRGSTKVRAKLLWAAGHLDRLAAGKNIEPIDSVLYQLTVGSQRETLRRMPPNPAELFPSC
jgi:hypothetical protein